MTAKSSTPSSKDSHLTSPSSSFLPFPPELRNKILSLALTGGHVYLRSSSDSGKLSHKPKTVDSELKSTPAINLLATCRQAYDEGHVMYYSDNVFHLPPGRCEDMKEVLAKIKPEHLTMMKHVVLRLSLLDLTPSVLREVEEELSTALPMTPSTSYSLADALWKIWVEKLSHARSTLENLGEVRVTLSQENPNGGKASMVVANPAALLYPPNGLLADHPFIALRTVRPTCSGPNARAVIKNFIHTDKGHIDKWSDDVEGSMKVIIWDVVIRAHCMIYLKIDRMGWEKFKNWLSPAAVALSEAEENSLPASELSRGYWPMEDYCREVKVEMVAVTEKDDL